MPKLINRQGQVLSPDVGLIWLTLTQWREQGTTMAGQRLGLEFQPDEHPESVA